MIAFRSHWGFQTEFCNPARGNEKGGVEGEVGYFRRNHLVPVPTVARSGKQLNEPVAQVCQQDEQRRIAERRPTSARRCGSNASICCRCPRKDSSWRRNQFPDGGWPGLRECGLTSTRCPCERARVASETAAAYVEIWQEGECVARHERSFGRYQQVLDLEHYLDVLEKKPGALAGSTPLGSGENAGRWPASFDRLWESLSNGTANSRAHAR